MGKIIAVVSGKGGTGKTSFTANVGLALAALGKNTLCLDCDITLRNLDLALGLTDKALMDFSDVIAGRCSLSDAAADHPKYPGLHLLTAPLSPGGQLDVTDEQMRQLLDQVRQEYDYCLIDAPAGLGQGFRLATGCADCVVVITTTDASALRDAQHTVMLLDVPVMTPLMENEARRFIALVDEFYERHVKLVVSAEVPLYEVYQGERLKFEFQRCLSRLQEMQSEEYLKLEHMP